MRATVLVRRLVAIASVTVALAACSAMPFSTMWKMRNFSIDDVLALRPDDLRVAVAFDMTTRMNSGRNQLVLGLMESGKRHAYHFGLQSAPGTDAPDNEHLWTIMRLTPASAADFAKLQARVRSSPKQFSFADFNWKGGELDFTDEKSTPALLHLSVDLRLQPQEWLPLAVDYPVRVEVDQAGAPQ
jgi:hypothetical protein